MTRIIKYIFSRVYFFYKGTLGIKHNAYIYPSIFIGFILAFNFVALLYVPLLIVNVNNVSIQLIFILCGLITIFLTMVYIRAGERYKRILNDVEGYADNIKKRLKFKSIVYFAISIVIFIWVMHLTFSSSYLLLK